MTSRMCGFLFCNDCSEKRMYLPNEKNASEKVRVCDLCAVKIRFHSASSRKITK